MQIDLGYSSSSNCTISRLNYGGFCHYRLMMSVSPHRIALFIDGPNFYATAKALGLDVDYKRVLNAFDDRGTLVRAFYYAILIEDQEYSSIRPLVDWLDYNGFTVVTKATKEFVDA